MKELWLIDEANHTVEVRVLDANRLITGQVLTNSDEAKSSVLEGFSLTVEGLFD